MKLRTLIAVGFWFASGAAAQVTALTHATVIDGTGNTPQRDATIVIENGRIRDIGPSSLVQVPAGATVVDLTGKFIVPGIINAHGHVGPNRDPQLRQYALYGVTTTTSMSFDDDDIAQFKEEQKRGNLRGARILTVKYRFMSAPNIPGSEVKTPEQARAKVDEIVAKGADFVKVWVDGQGGKYPKLTPEFCAAVFDEARKYNKTTMAHIVEYADAKKMVDLGVDILVHGVRDRVIDDDFIATLKQRNVSLISTLAREESMFVYGESPAWLADPFFRKGLRGEQSAKLAQKQAEQARDPQHEQFKRMFEIDKINLKKLTDAGVRIALGTDSGGALDRFFIQGFAEHRQMQLMVEAGLTPMQVIQAFSKGASETLRIDRDFGTLLRGKAADLLVLGRNPLENITNMRGIEAVYLGGRKFE
ncbi:MAG: amidohydrolase family protein [Bryobacteraceae bacterium]|jgi:imidazolonepropionase-like amidohydrolase